MAGFYRIQIGAIYLTKTGANTGKPCKLEVSNLEDLLTTVIGVPMPSIVPGKTTLQLVPWAAGKTFEIKVLSLSKTVWESLRDFLNDKLENDSTFTVIGTGDIGNFSVTCKPFPQKPFSAGSFQNGWIQAATFRFVTV